MRQFLDDPALGLVKSRRPQQLDMFDRALDILQGGGIGLIQAGTGTGKSYAYLLAAIRAIELGMMRRVVVSTAKKTLQSQLFLKDLPAIMSLVKPPLRYAVLKGQNNYICQLRHSEFANQGGYDRHRGFPREEFEQWMADHPTGDLSAFPQEIPFEWDVQVTGCAGSKCPYYTGCGFVSNKQDAKEASILIVNHTLLALDIQLGGGKILGEYDGLIIDEAHQLAGFSRKAFSSELMERHGEMLERALGQDARIKFPDHFKGAYKDLFDILKDQAPGPYVPNGFAITRIKVLHQMLTNLLGQLKRLDGSGDKDEGGSTDASPPDADHARKHSRISGNLRLVEQSLTGLSIVLQGAERKDYLVAIERRDNTAPPVLSVMPLEIGPFILPALKKLNKVVATSATLATTDGFGFIRRELGLSKQDTRVEERLESPFEFKRQSCLYVPSTARLPGFSRDERLETTARYVREIHEIAEVSGGGCFVLCCSKVDMLDITNGLRKLRSPHYRVLMQSDQVDRDIKEFASGYDNVLIGVKSLWEGVDQPGQRLRCVIIPRLPFPNPSDFLHTARKDLARSRLLEQGVAEGAVGMRLFMDFDLQQSAMDLVQGAGRLIRTSRDFGALVVLDPRINPGFKQYSAGLRALLPHPSVTDRETFLRLLRVFRAQAEKEKAASS